uniref:(California timema) hypothetical protein n=1 Tax=Timema californicum TaxID=61474 RepID=A0A7R9JH47_TIMCA|nr:unnamed protein product [Timema californicum]
MSENSEVGLVAPTSGSQRNLSKASVTSLAGSLEILNKSPSILPSDDVFDKGEDVVNHRVSCWGKIVNFLDLKLLLDPIYSNIAVGIAFTFTADIMFFTIHPIYLFYLGFSNPETAACISIGLACDLGGRLFLTVLGLFAQVKSRTLVLFGSTATVFFRTIFVMYEDHLTIVILTGVLNFFRSFLMVELPLVFAEFCSVERFPSAYGLYLVICGILPPAWVYTGLRRCPSSNGLLLSVTRISSDGLEIPWSAPTGSDNIAYLQRSNRICMTGKPTNAIIGRTSGTHREKQSFPPEAFLTHHSRIVSSVVGLQFGRH